MQPGDFFEPTRNTRAARPALLAVAPEVALAEIFDPDKAFRRIVKEIFGARTLA